MMHIVPVDSKALVRAFLDVPKFIQKGNPQWIQPLDKDIEDIFNPERNKTFRHGTCMRWLLRNDQGQFIGRVAAFVNKKYRNKGDEQATGCMGFFECIDDQQAANLLFDTCKQWLAAQGMEAMDGPVNFGDRDRWWGLLVEGFHEPLYGMNYNPPYYKKLFETYGFEVFFNQICFAMKVHTDLSEKFQRRHAQYSADPAFRCEHLRKGNLMKYAADFCTVYNKAWAGHGGNKSMELRQAQKLFQSMKPVIDESLVWFVYHHDEPIAMWVNLPDLNQYFKHLHGKFGLLGKLRFLLMKRLGQCRRAVGLVFGVIPDFQGKGVDSYMILEGAKLIQRNNRYEDFEMQWIGDFNPKMINVAISLMSQESRRLSTYRYLFDRSKPFKRHPMLN